MGILVAIHMDHNKWCANDLIKHFSVPYRYLVRSRTHGTGATDSCLVDWVAPLALRCTGTTGPLSVSPVSCGVSCRW